MTVGGGAGDFLWRAVGGEVALATDAPIRFSDALLGGGYYAGAASLDGSALPGGQGTTTSAGRVEATRIDYGSSAFPGGAWVELVLTGERFWLAAHEGGLGDGGGAGAGDGGVLDLSDHLVLNGTWYRSAPVGGKLQWSTDAGVTWVDVDTTGGGGGGGGSTSDPDAPYVVLWNPTASQWETVAGVAVTALPTVGTRVIWCIAFVVGVPAPSWFRANRDVLLVKA